MTSSEVALVTGASAGIGHAIARALHDEGYRVALVGRRAERLAELAGHMPGSVTFVADLSLHDHVEALVPRVVEETGRIDVLVNAAGAAYVSSLTELTEREWRRVVQVNLSAPVFLMQGAARAMIGQGVAGRIVNVTSIDQSIPIAGIIHYNAAKAGLMLAARTAALELAAHGIRVNVVAPGMVDTRMARPTLENPELRADIMHHLPLGRVGRPADVVPAALYLCDPSNDWITGQSITVDGGMSLMGQPSFLWPMLRAQGRASDVPQASYTAPLRDPGPDR